MKGTAFKNEFGIQTNHGIPKPSYRMFETLHKAGTAGCRSRAAARTAEAFALTDGAKATVIIYNHDIERREISPEEVTLTLKGHIIDKVRRAVIDDGHTDPRAAWEAMGSPKYLSKDQVCALKKASELRFEAVRSPAPARILIPLPPGRKASPFLRCITGNSPGKGIKSNKGVEKTPMPLVCRKSLF